MRDEDQKNAELETIAMQYKFCVEDKCCFRIKGYNWKSDI